MELNEMALAKEHEPESNSLYNQIERDMPKSTPGLDIPVANEVRQRNEFNRSNEIHPSKDTIQRADQTHRAKIEAEVRDLLKETLKQINASEGRAARVDCKGFSIESLQKVNDKLNEKGYSTVLAYPAINSTPITRDWKHPEALWVTWEKIDRDMKLVASPLSLYAFPKDQNSDWEPGPGSLANRPSKTGKSHYPIMEIRDDHRVPGPVLIDPADREKIPGIIKGWVTADDDDDPDVR